MVHTDVNRELFKMLSEYRKNCRICLAYLAGPGQPVAGLPHTDVQTQLSEVQKKPNINLNKNNNKILEQSC